MLFTIRLQLFTFQATLRKLNPDDVMKASKQCMAALLRMLTVSKVGGVQEDAFMAVGTMVECKSSHDYLFCRDIFDLC